MLDKEKIDAMFAKSVTTEFNETNTVNHPAYYNDGNIEVIDYIQDKGFISGFCLGNAIKYISRAGKKDLSTKIEDLSKARWYLDRYIQYLQDKNES